jgi:hypothetical protein
MDIKAYETLIVSELKNVINTIIKNTPTLPVKVAAGERQGDYISKHLEKEFVINTKTHSYFKKSTISPNGKTKSPYDVETFFEFKGHSELIWIDFKAVNRSNKDSNPDGGTPDKIIKLINDGNYYLVYIFVFYEGKNDQLSFTQKDGEFVKSYFLKDVNKSVRVTPANQLQVKYSELPQYRTRDEFIKFLLKKKKEGLERLVKNTQAKLDRFNLDIVYQNKKQRIKISSKDMLNQNIISEDKIKNL